MSPSRVKCSIKAVFTWKGIGMDAGSSRTTRLRILRGGFAGA
jgi:hypothetical protein